MRNSYVNKLGLNVIELELDGHGAERELRMLMFLLLLFLALLADDTGVVKRCYRMELDASDVRHVDRGQHFLGRFCL